MTFMHPALESYRETFFRSVAEFHDQEIEWQLPSQLPTEFSTTYRRTENPSGLTQGPPAKRHGMTHPG
jgi:hypothetical protein